MSVEKKSFHYRIFFKQSQDVFEQKIEFNNDQYVHPEPELDRTPNWCNLEYKQCPNCTLNAIWHKHCPLALRLTPLVELPHCTSYDKVSLEVVENDSTYRIDTTAQEALSSLLGLLVATSGCPHTQFFKPLAWFHQPFASNEETVYRVCSAFLMSSVVYDQPLSETPFEALKEIYANMHLVNVHIASRIHNVLDTDSTVNAIVLLDLLTKDLPTMVDDDFVDLEWLFKCHRFFFVEK